jgi:purine-binding chemotaxis protein CheW
MSMTVADPVSGVARAPAPREYLAFTLGDEAYAVDLLDICEIRACEAATRVAGAPPWMLGVINLRGTIVPLVDLRLRFGMDAVEPGAFAVIIVVQAGARQVGVRVDALHDVVELAPSALRAASEGPQSGAARHLRGLAVSDGRLLMVLDIVALLQASRFDAAPEVLAAGEAA